MKAITDSNFDNRELTPHPCSQLLNKTLSGAVFIHDGFSAPVTADQENANSADLVLYIPTLNQEDILLSAENITEFISNNIIAPPVAIITAGERLGLISSNNFMDLVISAASSVLRDGGSIRIMHLPATGSVNGSEQLNLLKTRILKEVLAHCNIEDLYPSHPWKIHKEESASLALHNLAAIFIRLEDYDSAIECLETSEQYEESPRSLAMRGIVALRKGDNLEAVTKIVSSLQGYEVRKSPSQQHMLSFPPTNIERLNLVLQEGLDALNSKKNSEAARLFRNALDDFDPFYRESMI